jgi:hypothetical protein
VYGQEAVNEQCRTPLWSCVNCSTLWSGIRDIDVVDWMMDQGADPFWIHPTHLTTPAHTLCRMTRGNTTNAILVLKHRDNCSCFCSPGGCFVIGCALPRLKFDAVDHQRKTDDLYLFALVDTHRDSPWMSSAILRVLTFENLSLTHTCCYRVRAEICGYLRRPTPEEAEVIYKHERGDIELFDKLVAEFERKWAAYTKPFVTFMNRVWKPRMRAVRQER